MARWRLISAHYLAVPGTEWKYEETDRLTGKMNRKIFTVPVLLDPKQTSDQNYPDEIIVANAHSNEHPRDIVFVGPPTPDMEPLDDEAIALSKAESPKWIHPIESLPATGDSTAQLLALLTSQLQAAQAPKTQSLAGVDPAEFQAMKKQLAELAARNAELEAKPAVRRA